MISYYYKAHFRKKLHKYYLIKSTKPLSKGSDYCNQTKKLKCSKVSDHTIEELRFDSRISDSKSNGPFVTTNYLLTTQNFMLGYFDSWNVL